MKKAISLILTLALVLCMIPSAFAASSEATKAADALNALGLFNGTGKDANGKPIYDLDRAPTRAEAVTMLVRLLGKADEAAAGTWKTPFTDVADWAKPYVGYAYANKLTSGMSATTFGGSSIMTATQYITLVLCALGYKSGTDFQWDKAWELSDKIGLTDGRYNADTDVFLRGDVAIISYKSLSCEQNDHVFDIIPTETAAQKEVYKEVSKAIYAMNFPENAKGLTLSWEQARALVGKDLETVKRHVRSLEDCLYYLSAAGYASTSGDLTYTSGSITWHFNYSPQVVFNQNAGNCGGTSGLVACLLEGDYDEVGIVSKSGKVREGGHIVNYLKDGKTYSVFDVNRFFGGAAKWMNIYTGADLNATVIKAFSGYADPSMVLYTYSGSYDGDAPIGWNANPTNYIINGYSENVNIVLETPESGYVYKYISVEQSVLDKIEEIRNR